MTYRLTQGDTGPDLVANNFAIEIDGVVVPFDLTGATVTVRNKASTWSHAMAVEAGGTAARKVWTGPQSAALPAGVNRVFFVVVKDGQTTTFPSGDAGLVMIVDES